MAMYYLQYRTIVKNKIALVESLVFTYQSKEINYHINEVYASN